MNKSIKKETAKKRLLFFFYGLLIILLPWQTRWIFFDQKIQGEVWEYGRLGIYASMLTLFLLAVSFACNTSLKPYFSKDKFLYISFIYFFIVSIFSPIPQISFYYLLMIFLAILFAYIFRHLPKVFSFSLLLLSGLLQSIFAIYQFSTQSIGANKWLGMASHLPQNLGDSVVEFSGIRILRAYGSFSHPNVLGGFLVLTIFAGIYLWISFYQDRQKEKWQKHLTATKLFYFLFIIASLIISSFALLASFSRSALLALAISLVSFFIISIIKKKWLTTIVVGKYIIFFILMIMVFNILVPNAWQSRIKSEGRLETKSNVERVDSFGHFYWNDWRDVLFGQGLGMNTFVSHQNNIDKPIYATQPIHNVFLLALAEIGILGIIFLFGILFKFWGVFKKANNLAKCLFFSFIIIAMFDHYFWTSWSGWLMMAFVLANLYKQKQGI